MHYRIAKYRFVTTLLLVNYFGWTTLVQVAGIQSNEELKLEPIITTSTD
jgi:hypothetical protein